MRMRQQLPMAAPVAAFVLFTNPVSAQTGA